MVTYSRETWVLKEYMKQKLLINERKIFRRIYGPTKERDGTWRIKINCELNNLITNKNIINYIKAQRMSWFGNVYGMTNDRMLKKTTRMESGMYKTSRKTKHWMGKRCKRIFKDYENKYLDKTHPGQ